MAHDYRIQLNKIDTLMEEISKTLFPYEDQLIEVEIQKDIIRHNLKTEAEDLEMDYYYYLANVVDEYDRHPVMMRILADAVSVQGRIEKAFFKEAYGI